MNGKSRRTDVSAAAAPLVVAHVVEAATAGIRRHVFDLMSGLHDRGIRQALVYSRVRADRSFLVELPRWEAVGIQCIEVRMVRELRPVADLAAVARLAAVFREVEATIIHLHSSKAGGLGRLAAILDPRIRTVYTPNAAAIHLSPLYLVIERLLGRLRTDALVAVSSSEFQELRRAKVVVADRLHEIASGIDIDATRTMADAYTPEGRSGAVVCAGRLTRQKDPLTLVRASDLVLRARPDVQFVWVGDGELRGAFETLADELGVRHAWRLTGWLDNPLPWIRSAGVFVLPSLYESFGYVTLEAMALSRPVVATRVAGSRDLVRDGESGLLVEPGDDRALGDAVLRLLSDRALAAKFGAAGAARAEYFTRSRMATAIASLYGHILRS